MVSNFSNDEFKLLIVSEVEDDNGSDPSIGERNSRVSFEAIPLSLQCCAHFYCVMQAAKKATKFW